MIFRCLPSQSRLGLREQPLARQRCCRKSRAGSAGGWAQSSVPLSAVPVPPTPGTHSLLGVSPSPCVCKSWHSEPSLPLWSWDRSHQPGWNIRWDPKATQTSTHPTQQPPAPKQPLHSTKIILFHFFIVIYNLSRVKTRSKPGAPDGEQGDLHVIKPSLLSPGPWC